MKQSRQPVWKGERERKSLIFRLAQKYGWVCWYCNLPLNPAYLEGVDKHDDLRDRGNVTLERSHVRIHIDHIIPAARGGRNEFDNYALACEFCNRAKVDLDLETFLTWLDRIRYSDTWTPIRDGPKRSKV